MSGYYDIDTDSLGDGATSADVAEYIELCEQVQAIHPELDDEEVNEAVWGNGDYYRNAKRLGATIR